jgi:hypothetical protein
MPQIISVLTLKVLGLVRSIFNNDVMDAHIKSMDIFDKHKIQLLKLVIETYLKCRLHYEATKNNEKEEYTVCPRIEFARGKKKLFLILRKNFRGITFFASSETPISVIKKSFSTQRKT